MQRPKNAEGGQRQRRQRSQDVIIGGGTSEGSSESKGVEGNPWQHDLDLVNLLGEGEASSTEKVAIARQMGAAKLLDVLEGKVEFDKVGIKLPKISKDPALEAVKKHPLAVDQGNYLNTNLRRFDKQERERKKKGHVIDQRNPVFARAVSDLPVGKQKVLLSTLSKISKSLEFGGLAIQEDEHGIVSHHRSTRDMDMAGSGITREGGMAAAMTADTDTFSQSDTSASKTSGGYTSGISGSMVSSGNKSYGRSDTDNAEEVVAQDLLSRIGAAMEAFPQAAFKYSNCTGRAKGSTPAMDMVSPTQIMAILQLEFGMNITTAENVILFNRFDVDSRGVVSLGAILGSAKLANDKKVYTKTMNDLTILQEQSKKELIAKRKQYQELIGGHDSSGKKVDGKLRQQTMKSIIDKLAAAAYIGIRARQLKPLNVARARLTSKEFRQLLTDIGVNTLLPREISLLERRYYVASSGSIDLQAFKSEYIQLGKDVIQERMREQALQSFLKTLQGSNVHPEERPKDKGKDKDKEEDGGEGKTIEATAEAGAGVGSGVDAEQSDLVTLSKNPLSSDRRPANSVEAYLIDNNGVDKDKVAGGMSIEMAEEWIADPLGGSSTGGGTSPSAVKRSAMLDQYGPSSRANQNLPVYSEIDAAEKIEHRGPSNSDDGMSQGMTSGVGVGVGTAPLEGDDAASVGGMSAITAGSLSIADNASTTYADSIAGSASSRRSKASSSGKSSSKSTMSLNPEAQAARSKARARFYAELEEAQRQADDENTASGGDAVQRGSAEEDVSVQASVDLNKLEIGDALSIATVSSTPIAKGGTSSSRAVKSENGSATPESTAASVTSSSPSAGVLHGKAALSSGYSASRLSDKDKAHGQSTGSSHSPKKTKKVVMIKPATPDHDLRVMDTLDLGVTQGPSAGGGAMFEEGAGNLELPFEMTLSTSTLQQHKEQLANSPEAAAAAFESPEKLINPNVAKSGLMPVIQMQKSDCGERPVTREWDPAPAPAPAPGPAVESQSQEPVGDDAGFEADGVFWAVGATEEGDSYFYDVATGLSQWEDPREAGNVTKVQDEQDLGQDIVDQQEQEQEEKEGTSNSLAINGGVGAAEDDDDGYDLGLHTIDLAGAALTVEASDDVLNMSATAL